MPFYLFVFTLHNFISFSCLIAKARTSNTSVLNRSDTSGKSSPLSQWVHFQCLPIPIIMGSLFTLSWKIYQHMTPENYRFHSGNFDQSRDSVKTVPDFHFRLLGWDFTRNSDTMIITQALCLATACK